MSEAALDKKKIITELTKSAHGDLSAYLAIGRRAAIEDPNFFAHLVAWNHQKGQIRDAKVALPVIALAALQTAAHRYDIDGRDMDAAYAENALAHLADLRPRELAKVCLQSQRAEKTDVKVKKGEKRPPATMISVPPFAKTAGAPKRVMRRLVTRYLRNLEAKRGLFERVAVQHGGTLHDLYEHYHVSRPAWVGEIVFHGEKGQPKALPGGIFAVIRGLHLMSVVEAAGNIVKFKIPFLIARGALGKKANEPDTVLALIKAMSPTELVTNAKWLDKLGVKTNPALRAAFQEAMGRAASTTKSMATLKTSRAAAAMDDDDVLSSKLHALQEKQIDQMVGVDGDWLVAGDASGSMAQAIELARQVSATLARMVKGRVHLVLFDTMPVYFDVTGKTLEEITTITRGVTAGGGTSIGCALQYLLDKKIAVDGIALVSDGGENVAPRFGQVYAQYCDKLGVNPTVYLYQTNGDSDQEFNQVCAANHVDVQRFDLRGQKVDYYSLPNLTQTMRVSRYSLLDEVMATPLRTLDEVLDQTKDVPVLPKQLVTA